MFDELLEQLKGDPIDSLTRGQLTDRFAAVRRLKGAIGAYEARLIRAVDGLGDRGLDGRGVMRSQGKTSDKAASRAAKTAKRLPELPKVQQALEDGRITSEHADAIVDAAEKTSPEQAEEALLDDDDDEIAPADVFAKRSREWASKHGADDGADERTRQRRDRSGRRWTDTQTGMSMFLFALDREAGDAARKALIEREQKLWRDDGGRDGDPADMRTDEQRIADAFVELVTGSRATSPSHPRHQVNVVVDLAGTSDDVGRPLASLVADGRPLPAAVLERLTCTAGLTPMIFDGPGRPIWVGRDHRGATLAQWRALIARDRGCVGCGADVERCEAHHVRPWELGGLTDITNLVLVCSRCHHDIHDRGMELRRSNGRWVIVSRDGPGHPPRHGERTGHRWRREPRAA